MKTPIFAFALVFAAGCEVGPASSNGASSALGSGDLTTATSSTCDHHHGDHHRGPPPEALAACENHADGDACTVTHHDRTLEGTCRTGPRGEPAACFPAGFHGHDGHEGPGGPPHGHHGPPPQVALDACASLAADAACSFTGREGQTINGTCHQGPNGEPAACFPAHRHHGDGPDLPPPPR